MEWLAVTGILEPICIGLIVGLILAAELLFIISRIEASLERRSAEKHAPVGKQPLGSLRSSLPATAPRTARSARKKEESYVECH